MQAKPKGVDLEFVAYCPEHTPLAVPEGPGRWELPRTLNE